MATHPSRFSKRTKIVAASTLAAFFVIGGSYLLYHYQKPSRFLSSRPSKVSELMKGASSNSSNSTTSNLAIQVTISPTSTPDPYAGWVVEKTTEFSLKHPGDWYNAQQMGLNNVGSNGVDFSTDKIKIPSLLSKTGIFGSAVDLGSQPTNMDLLMFSSPNGPVPLEKEPTGATNLVKIADLNIAGYPAVSYSMDYPNENAGYELFYTLKRNGDYISLEFLMNDANKSKYSDIVNLILQSFKFIN